MSDGNAISLLSQLEAALARQVERARGGDYDARSAHMVQAAGILERLSRQELTKDVAAQAGRVQRLIAELQLAAESQKQETLGQMGRIRQGRKAVTAYKMG